MADPGDDPSDPTDDKDPNTMDPSSTTDQEWDATLTVFPSPPVPTPPSLDVNDEPGMNPVTTDPDEGSSSVTASFVESFPDATNTGNSSLVLETSQTSDFNQTQTNLEEIQHHLTDFAICNQMLEDPSPHLYERSTVVNNINFLFSQFASGELPCTQKAQVKFLAQDLMKKGILDKSSQFLYKNWPHLQGSDSLDVLLLLYTRLVEKSSSQMSNQTEILQRQLDALSQVSFALDLEKTKNQALLDEKESVEHELEQKKLETATNQTIEDKYIHQLAGLKTTMLQLRENSQDLKTKLQTQTETVSNLRIQQASMVSLEESSTELAESKKSLDQVEAEKKVLETKHEDLATDLSKNSAKLAILAREAVTAQTAIKHLQEQLEAAQKENAKKQITITDLNVIQNTTTEELQSLTSDHDKLTEDLSTKDKKIASLQRKLADKDKLLSKDKPAQQQVALAHKKEIESLLSKIEALQKDKQKANAALTSKSADLEKMKRNLQKVEKQLTEVTKTHESCVASTSVDDPSIAHMEERLSVAEYTNEELQRAIDDLQDETNNKEAQIRSLQDKVLSLNLRLEGSAAEEAVIEMQQKIAALEKDLEKAAAQSNDLGEAKETLETDLDEANEKILDLKERLDAKEIRISKILQERRLSKVDTDENKFVPAEPVGVFHRPRSSTTPTLPSASSLHESSDNPKGEKEKAGHHGNPAPSPSSDGSQASGAFKSPVSSSPSTRSPTPIRTVVENPDDFPCEPIDPSAEFPLDFPNGEPQTPAIKRRGESPNMDSKLTRFSQSPQTIDDQPMQEELQPQIRPPLLKADQFEHYDRITRIQHSNVLNILRSSKGKIIARLQSDRQFIEHLRGNHSEVSKQNAVTAVLRSLSQCATIKQLNNWTPLQQSQNDFLPFPDLSEHSPEWNFIEHRRGGPSFIHHGAVMALFRAYCSKAYRFFEFVKVSPDATSDDARLTFIHLHPLKKDKTGAIRSIWEKKLDLVLVLLIVRLALYETDKILVFPSNKKRMEHYVNVPFSPAWIDEMMETRSPSDPYLLPKHQFLNLYVNCRNCSNAINAWEGRHSVTSYHGAQGSIMDRLK